MFFPSSEIKELLFWVCAEQVVGASAAAAGGCTSHLKWQNESSCKPLRGLLAQSTNRSPWEVNTLIGLKCSMFPIWRSQTLHTLLCSVVFIYFFFFAVIYFIYFFLFFQFYFIFKLYIIVLVLPNIKMNQKKKKKHWLCSKAERKKKSKTSH